MATLIIHAPKAKEEQEGKMSFDRTIELFIGEGYAISKADFDRLWPGDTVVVLCKDSMPMRRVEGVLVRLVPNGKTKSGMQRYDVHFKDPKEVLYRDERFGRTGILVI